MRIKSISLTQASSTIFQTCRFILWGLLCFFLVFSVQRSQAQAVFENVNNSIYDYLYRNAQKGNIELDDFVKPFNRNQIAGYLLQIRQRYDSLPESLNKTERKELDFYIAEYGLGITEGIKNASNEKWLGKDPRGRLRFFYLIQPDSLSNSKLSTSVAKSPSSASSETLSGSLSAGSSVSVDQSFTQSNLATTSTAKQSKIHPFQFNIEPIIQGSVHKRNEDVFMRRAVGVQFWASLGKRWGVQAYYKDVTEDGEGIDLSRQFTPENGIIKVTNPTRTSLNYSDVRGSISYQWNSGMLSVGKEQLVVGYGLNGNIIHSTKAPSYPYLRLQQKILKWLKFEYTHAILSSGLVDTPNSYRTTNLGVFGGQRFKLIPKYLVNHSLNFRLMKGLDLQLGESVVYSDRVQFGYWLPVMFFKAWDQYISGNQLNAGANTQLYGQISSRNQIPFTHLYASMFIDEISPTVIFNPDKSRNQLAYQIGASITELPGLPYLTLNGEYTRLNPFVYKNLLPAQEFTSSGYVLGDWMGSNADRYVLEARYSPMPRLRLLARQERIRKGGEGSTEQQYFARPQPMFLFDLQRKEWNRYFRAVYEWKHNIYLNAQYQHQELKLYQGNFNSTTNNYFSIGFSLGL